MESIHRIVLVGLGATGIAIGQSLRLREDCKLVGATDIDPSLTGRDLGVLLGGAELGVRVAPDFEQLPTADAAIVATGSYLDALEPIVTSLLEAGVNVLSICEQLGYPFITHPDIAHRLDRAARHNGVSLLGTGCNPGMIMDTIPILLSGLTQRVDKIEIERTADMSRYGTLLEKFGLGLTTDEFAVAQDAGTVTGHIGFEQSITALATALGWELNAVEVDPVRVAFVTPAARCGKHTEIPARSVAAVRHAARGKIGGVTAIDVAIYFGFFEQGDPVERGDFCRIVGSEQQFQVAATPGYESFLSTVAAAVNAVTAVIEAEPGLHSVADLAVHAVASKGVRLVDDGRPRTSGTAPSSTMTSAH